MRHRLFLRLHNLIHSSRVVCSEEFFALLLVLVGIAAPVAAATRFQDRGLFMQSAVPGATTSYTISFEYISPEAVGSVDMIFCNSPIPYDPCVAPTGLDVSHATLSSQSGETGFHIATQTSNHIVLSRTPTPISTSGLVSSYTFTGVVNPTDTSQAFALRMKSMEASDGTGPQIDFGSMRAQVTNSIVLETQVPPILNFCAAQEVAENCSSTNDTYYSDMGSLSPNATLTAQSQMAIGTNASGGFAITAVGGQMAAGTHVIDSPTAPTLSQLGSNQFGINLVANTFPSIGQDPEGPWTNAAPTNGYGDPNHYKFVSGDVVASSPNVSLMRKFTVSYILNSSKDLRAGVYTTTITYVASGRF